MTQSAHELKGKILQTLNSKGPSLPVHLANAIGQSILFTSAFLSELMAEKKIKQSHMRVGSSPIYFLIGQEPQLEKYSEYIKGKEKEALLLLKQNRFLDDEKQLPAIKVALRAIKDFAIPFSKNNEIIWRYFLVPETEYKIELPEEFIEQQKEVETQVKEIIKEEAEKRQIQKEKEKTESLNIFDEKPKEKIKKKTVKKPSPSQKKNEKFFNKVKEYLTANNLEILDIEGFNKDNLTLKISKAGKELLLVAYDKKRIGEKEITDAYKKAQEQNLNYTVLSLGDLTRKLSSFIEAIKCLEAVEKIE